MSLNAIAKSPGALNPMDVRRAVRLLPVVVVRPDRGPRHDQLHQELIRAIRGRPTAPVGVRLRRAVDDQTVLQDEPIESVGRRAWITPAERDRENHGGQRETAGTWNQNRRGRAHPAGGEGKCSRIIAAGHRKPELPRRHETLAQRRSRGLTRAVRGSSINPSPGRTAFPFSPCTTSRAHTWLARPLHFRGHRLAWPRAKGGKSCRHRDAALSSPFAAIVMCLTGGAAATARAQAQAQRLTPDAAAISVPPILSAIASGRSCDALALPGMATR
jgi:hypothetical protein